MTTITLTRSQGKLLENACGPVAICNESGHQVGFMVFEPQPTFVADLTSEQAEELASRMSIPDPKWLTIDEVLDDPDERDVD